MYIPITTVSTVQDFGFSETKALQISVVYGFYRYAAYTQRYEMSVLNGIDNSVMDYYI